MYAPKQPTQRRSTSFVCIWLKFESSSAAPWRSLFSCLHLLSEYTGLQKHHQQQEIHSLDPITEAQVCNQNLPTDIETN